MIKVSDVNIAGYEPLLSPEDFCAEIPKSAEQKEFISNSRVRSKRLRERKVR